MRFLLCSLVVCLSDEEWFIIPVGAGKSCDVRIRRNQGTDVAPLDLFFVTDFLSDHDGRFQE